MIILIDNYDSFTYNLVQYFKELGASLEVFKNDQVSEENLPWENVDALVISPGPGTPENAGISKNAIKLACQKSIPVLGVCLGFQAIGEVFGARLTAASTLMHGKISPIIHDSSEIFKNIPSPFNVTRYHSLMLEKESIPRCLKITAKTSDGTVMALKHKKLPVYGVQFHPEAILTEYGHLLLENFINLTR